MIIVVDDNKPLTTGQVAQICRCTPRTVAKWCDKGLIRFWLVPGGQDRRIPREGLLRFMRDRGMDIPIGLDGTFSSEA